LSLTLFGRASLGFTFPVFHHYDHANSVPHLFLNSPLRDRKLLFNYNPVTLITMPSYDPYEDALMASIEDPDHQKIVKEPESMAFDDVDKNVWGGSVWEDRASKPVCFPSSRTGTLLWFLRQTCGLLSTDMQCTLPSHGCVCIIRDNFDEMISTRRMKRWRFQNKKLMSGRFSKRHPSWPRSTTRDLLHMPSGQASTRKSA
jgi:hypothetical protein